MPVQPVDADTLTAARGGDKQAIVELMAIHLPEVWRMSTSLAGTESRGRAVVRRVMEQAQVAVETWEHEDEPTRWFRHHTILTLRQLPDAAPEAHQDVFLRPDDPADFRAFVVALRARPRQQREAFLLHHGEQFSARELGVAMDCSVEAAGVHLRGAGEALQPLAGKEFPRLLRMLAERYQSLNPPSDVAVRRRRRWLGSAWRRRMVAAGLFVGWALLLAFLALVIVAAWFLWGRIET